MSNLSNKDSTVNNQSTDNRIKTPWFGSTWFIIVMFILFWPVSIYLIWKYKGVIYIKIMVSVLFIFMYIAGIVITFYDLYYRL